MSWDTPQSLVDALDGIACDALQHQADPQSDETLVLCLICGEWEGHAEICPLPAIEKWLATPAAETGK